MRRFVPLLSVFLMLAALPALAVKQQNWPGQPPGPRAATAGPQQQWWGPPPPKGDVDKRPRAMGRVEAVGDSSVTLRTPCGFNTYAVTGTTVIKMQDNPNPAGLADIQVGYRANVIFKYMPDLTTQAEEIVAIKPQPVGRITAINGNVVTITDETEMAWQVTVGANTKIHFNKIPGTLADLRVDYWARAEGQADENHNVQAVAIQFRPPMFRGAVASVSQNGMTVKTLRQETIQCAFTDRTVIIIQPRTGPNTPGTRADIKQGMAVDIAGHRAEGQPMELLFVGVLIGQ